MMTKIFGIIVMIGGLLLLCSGAYTYHDILVTKKDVNGYDILTPYLLVIAGFVFTSLGILLIILDAG